MQYREMKPCLACDSRFKHFYNFKNTLRSLRKGASRMFDVQISIPQRDRYFSSLPPLYTTTTLLCSGYGRGWGVDSIENAWMFSSVSPVCHRCVMLRHRDNFREFLHPLVGRLAWKSVSPPFELYGPRDCCSLLVLRIILIFCT
jgi:hypothetical protein